MPMQTKIGKTTLRLFTGDIADQENDAGVTAAHWRLNKGTGTDGTIHTKGGPRIYEECRCIGGCPIGDAVITTGAGGDDGVADGTTSNASALLIDAWAALGVNGAVSACALVEPPVCGGDACVVLLVGDVAGEEPQRCLS